MPWLFESVELDIQQLIGIVLLGLLAGYFAGCARAAWVETRRDDD